MKEADIIDALKDSMHQSQADVSLSIGDDGAIIDLDDDKQMVTVTDAITVDVHYPAGIEAEAIGSILKAKEPEFPIEIHHGSLSREAREDAETRLRSGQPILVVCTSSLELGLDIGSIDNVMQFGSPRQAIKLIQRMGRSKHRTCLLYTSPSPRDQRGSRGAS